VAKQPREVTLRWSEPVDLGPGSVRLLDATGGEVKTGKAAHIGGDRTTARLALPAGLERGTYVVSWRVTSADSHPVSGAFSFSVGEQSSLVTAGAPGASSAVVKAVDGIARGLSFVGFALAVGGACVLLVLWPEGSSSTRGRRFLQVGVGALMLGTVALLVLQGPYTTGGSLLDAFKPSLLSFSLSTAFGKALAVRIVLTLAFAALVAEALSAAREPREAAAPGGAAPPGEAPAPGEAAAPGGAAGAAPRGVLYGAAACAVGLLFTWTLTDHSRTGVQTWLGVPAATVHLLAMSLWLGGLALLFVCVLAREGHASLLPVVPRFSQLALTCFVVLGVTGVYLAWRQSGELAALPATGFGRLLLIKSAIVLGIIALAALSRRAVARAGGDLARRLRRTVVAEAVLGVVVLGVTAGLVNAAPARVKYAKPIDVKVAGVQGGRVELKVAPAKQGQNVADIYLIQKDGRLYVPPELEVRLRGGDDLALPVEVAAAEPGHYVATALTVPSPGKWTIRLVVRTSEIDEQTIDIPVKIR
jgi:copper transport protein